MRHSSRNKPLPGSPEKIELLRQRLERGEQLHQEGDIIYVYKQYGSFTRIYNTFISRKCDKIILEEGLS